MCVYIYIYTYIYTYTNIYVCVYIFTDIHTYIWVSPGGSDGNESSCNVGYLGSIPGLGRSPGGGHGNPLQYSSLENPHWQRSLVGYSPWGCKESYMTEQLSTVYIYIYIKCGILWGSYKKQEICMSWYNNALKNFFKLKIVNYKQCMLQRIIQINWCQQITL